jgi:hypothetical protein
MKSEALDLLKAEQEQVSRHLKRLDKAIAVSAFRVLSFLWGGRSLEAASIMPHRRK